jgi:hypothetical protein
MVRNSRARAMVQQQPDTKSGGSSGHPGVVDPTNLGRSWIDVGDTTSPQMMVGGTLELPVVDAGVDAGEVDLSAAELSGGTFSRRTQESKRLPRPINNRDARR